MYGTIAKLTGKPGAVEEIIKMSRGRRRPGYIGSYVFKSDKVPDEFWLVAIFKDKKTYFENADSPEQDKEFRSLMQFLKTEPEWNDGEIIFEDKIE